MWSDDLHIQCGVLVCIGTVLSIDGAIDIQWLPWSTHCVLYAARGCLLIHILDLLLTSAFISFIRCYNSCGEGCSLTHVVNLRL
jgi:hypothetical protein